MKTTKLHKQHYNVLHPSTVSNAIFAVYKTSEATLDAANLSVQAINPEAILIPKPDDTPR